MAEIKDILNEKIKSDIVDLLMTKDYPFSQLLSVLQLKDHGQLNYHLKVLLKSGLLSKNSQTYSLSDIGRQIGVYIKQIKAEETYPLSVVCAVIFNANGEILLLRRSRHPCKEMWGLPGGKMRAGERIKDCAEREVFEETGLKLTFKKVIGFFPSLVFDNEKLSFHAMIIPALMSNVKNPKITVDPEEMDAYVFSSKKDLGKYSIIPNNLEILKKVHKKEFSFEEMIYRG